MVMDVTVVNLTDCVSERMVIIPGCGDNLWSGSYPRSSVFIRLVWIFVCGVIRVGV